MADAFVKRDEIVSEDAFCELTSLTPVHFRRLWREGRIPGVIRLANDSYIVDIQAFLAGVASEDDTQVTITTYDGRAHDVN